MRIGVCSWSDRAEVSEQTWPMLEMYCKRHGYKFITSNKVFDTTKPLSTPTAGPNINYSKYKVDITERPSDSIVGSSWMKLKMLQYQSDLDYLVWFDDDVVITGDDLLETYIQMMDKDTLFGMSKCSGCFGQPRRFKFNMGIVIVKCCDTTKQIIENLWYNGIQTKWRCRKLWEQDYVTTLYNNEPEFAKLFYLFDYGIIQTYVRSYKLPENLLWKPGDFSAHVTGNACNTDNKSRRIKDFITDNV